MLEHALCPFAARPPPGLVLAFGSAPGCPRPKWLGACEKGAAAPSGYALRNPSPAARMWRV